MRKKNSELFQKTQKTICQALEKVDAKAQFSVDNWERPDLGGSYGGGGITRILKNGGVFEQAAVNFSEVQGKLPRTMSQKLTGQANEAPFFATGISLVLHPESPMIPTTHANFRYLEVADLKWFGGGADLTPYYFFEEDAIHFHTVLKDSCENYDPSYYPRFKKECDEYFYLPHREEARGIGGIFYDYLGKEDPDRLSHYFDFSQENANSWLKTYLPIIERRRNEKWGEQEREFQLMRRGRYVEFNLIYDRGTQFGLQTSGRTESILASLPPLVRWEYNSDLKIGSREAKLLEILENPREWV